MKRARIAGVAAGVGLLIFVLGGGSASAEWFFDLYGGAAFPMDPDLTVTTERLSWVSSGQPWLVISEDRVEHGQELAHGGGEGDRAGVPGRAKALGEGRHAWVATDRGQGGHEQDPTDGAPAAADHAPAAEGATVTIERREADEGGDASAIKLAEFREFGDERQGRNWADPRPGGQPILGLAPGGRRADRLVEIRLELPEGALQPGDVGVDPPLESAIPGQAAAIRLGPEYLHELAAAGHEFAEALGVLGRHGADGRAHGLGEVRDDADIEGIGLGEEAGGPRTVADLAGIDDRDGTTRAGQDGRDGGCVAARGFQGDERGGQSPHAVDEGGQPRLVVGDREGLSGGAHVDVELRVGDIEADEEMVHAPSV